MKKIKITTAIFLSLLFILFAVGSGNSSGGGSNGDYNGGQEPVANGGGDETSIEDVILSCGDLLDFSDGYAFVEEGEDYHSYYIINTDGDIVGYTDRYCHYSKFSNGLAITREPAVVIDYTGAELDLGLDDTMTPCLITSDGNILVSQAKDTGDGYSYALGVVSKYGEWVCGLVDLPFSGDPDDYRFYYEDLGENVYSMNIYYYMDNSAYGQSIEEQFIFNADNGKYISIYEDASESTISNFMNGKAVLCLSVNDSKYDHQIVSLKKSDFSKTVLGTAKKAEITRQDGEEVFYYQDSTKAGYYDTDFSLIFDATGINASFGEYYDGYVCANLSNYNGKRCLAIYNMSGEYAFEPVEIADCDFVFGDGGVIGYEAPNGMVTYIDVTGDECISFDMSQSDEINKLCICGNDLVSDKQHYYDVNTGEYRF